jgi:hypothetical protein
VYHLTGAPLPDHLDLRAAWLQLAPGILAWERGPDQGVVSHRSAAVIFGLGHLPADRHEFTLPVRRQSRRADVRLHHRDIDDGEWISRRGMLVTRPSRIAADLLTDHEGPEAVGHLVADAIRAVYDYPSNFADSLARSAAHFGLRRGDGIGLLRWLLDLVGDPDTQRWMDEAHAHVDPDVARLLEDAVHRERRPMKQVVNDALRRALTAPSPHRDPLRVGVHESGLRPGLDLTGFNRLADELEDEAIIEVSRRHP